MKETPKKLYSSKKQLISIIIIVTVTLLVSAAVSCIIIFGLDTACSKEISNAYKSTVSRLPDEINGIGGLTSFGGILKESSAETSQENNKE